MTPVAIPEHKPFYTREDMALFNLLEHPIYVFDISNKCMWWANKEAVKMWNADSLSNLLERDFANDMSEASERRMLDYLRRFQKGERVRESWTMYPDGERTTTKETCCGIAIGPDEHVAILCECDLVKLREDVDHASLRGVEMLRHLPVAVSQFDIDGKLMDQNPEALNMFGGLKDNEKSSSSTSAEPLEELETDCFSNRFVDRDLGKQVLRQIQDGDDCSIEAQQHTRKGPRWSAIKVRKSRDPVLQDPVILYSARDITEVVNAKNEANRANMEKSEMLAVLAHEIRTPLHQVLGFIELLGKTKLSQEQKDVVHTLQSSTVSLMSIINDVLDFTKLEAGKMQIENIPFDPCAVCEGCMEAIGAVAEKQGLALNRKFATSVLGGLVMGDPNRIRQILLNLLSNACKFTHKGGVTLSLETKPVKDKIGRHLLKFSVKDTGIGIPPKHMNAVFHKFRQTDASIARQYGGTGLGLAICKILAEAMGGSLHHESEVNKGSEFSFEIPVGVCDPKMQVAASEALEEKNPVPNARLNVLVAEDNKINQKLVAAMLKHIGHNTTIVDNGKKVVEELEAGMGRYDIILMDIQMPVMDGTDATKLIRSKGWTKYMIPIVGLTASFQTAQLNYYQDIGMNDCIGKPVRMKSLKETIERTRGESSSPQIVEEGKRSLKEDVPQIKRRKRCFSDASVNAIFPPIAMNSRATPRSKQET